MILVTGANGTVGSEVARQLAAKACSVRAMVRKLENGAKLPRDRVDIVVGSFSDRDALDSAMKGVEAVFMISFEHPDQIVLQGNVIAATKRSRVRQVARLSAAEADHRSHDAGECSPADELGSFSPASLRQSASIAVQRIPSDG